MSAYHFNHNDVCTNPTEHYIYSRGRISLSVKTAMHNGKWTAGHNYSGHDHGSCAPAFKQCPGDEYSTESQAIISEINHVLKKWSEKIESPCKYAALEHIKSLNQISLF